MIIDCHTHGMSALKLEELTNAGGDWAKKGLDKQLGSSRSKGKPIFTDVKLRLEVLDKYGYSYQIVTPQWNFDSNLCPISQDARINFARAMNDNMARMQGESNGRLLCIGNVPLENYEKEGRKETERLVKTLGLHGVFVSTNIRGKPIDLPEFEPFWAHMVEMDLPVLLHPADPVSSVGRPYEARYDLMHNFGWPFETILTLAGMVFSGLMEKYPKIKLIGHHVGGGLPIVFGRTTETFEGRLQDKIGRELPKPIIEYFKLFYYDTAIGGSAQAIKCTYDVFGIDRIVFATDAPYGPGSGEMRLESYPKVVKSVGLTAAETKKIFEDNPKKLFKIK